MDPVSAILINRALDGLSMRFTATAENVANANSPGFRALRVSFEEALRTAAADGPAALARVVPQMERTAAEGGVRLDQELATASETAMRYGALLDLLGRQMQISRIAITGGQ